MKNEQPVILNDHMQYYDGKVYYKAPNGYYRTFKNGKYHTLHRVVWEHNNRPLTACEHVHHIDHDRANNNIDNLEMMFIDEHLRKHRLEELINEDRKCPHCGLVYTATRKKQVYCSATCRQRAAHARYRKKRG